MTKLINLGNPFMQAAVSSPPPIEIEGGLWREPRMFLVLDSRFRGNDTAGDVSGGVSAYGSGRVSGDVLRDVSGVTSADSAGDCGRRAWRPRMLPR
jgi:hypothetical protein